jgi:hypothetical protein
LPATDEVGSKNAGPTFELFGEIVISPSIRNRWALLDERLEAAANECQLISEGSSGPDDPVNRLSVIGESIRLLAKNLKNAANS